MDFGLWTSDSVSQHGAQDVWPRFVVARSEAEADFFGDQIFHHAEAFDEFREQRRAGGGDEFVRLVALRDADAARAENRQRRRRGNRKSTMRAIHPARALGHRRGQHARLAEQFQRDGRADDVHDGIHRADFVKMNLVRRQPVNFSLRLGDALEDGDGFLFDPRREFTVRDELFDFREIALLVVVMRVMRMFVTMIVVVVMRMTVTVLVMMVVVVWTWSWSWSWSSARCTSNFTPSMPDLCWRATWRW